MATERLSNAKKLEALRLREKYGTIKEAAFAADIPYRTLQSRIQIAEADPGIREALNQTGTSVITAKHGWTRVQDEETGNWNTVFWKLPDCEPVAFRETVMETLREVSGGLKSKLPKKFTQKAGNLLVLDPADVHVGKLSVATETGYTYNEDVAVHRLIEGSRALMEWGQREGVTRVLFVMGNDIAHIDNPKRLTTSGTPQDASASYFQIYRVAQKAYVEICRTALNMGLSLDVIHVPSNHDWTLGFCISNAVGLLFKDHENVNASDYMLSEMHRKYYRFGSNLMGLTHGDGAKEADLGLIMQAEARSHISECPHLYWYLHHYHHKIKKALGVRPQSREKDHANMTVCGTGGGAMEGDNVQIEYVRSPSDPDGWHHRNGYLNRQAVEAFIHHPHDGQILRKTEWY